MTTAKKIARLSFPVAIVAFGVFLLVTKHAFYGVLAPEVEGPIVVVVGVLLCLLGVWGFLGSLRVPGKKEEARATNQSGSDLE